MATYTTNLSLKKPATSENININDINSNMDKIDALANFTYGGVLETNTDLNDVVTPGVYMLSTTNTYINAPTGSRKSYLLMVLRPTKTAVSVFQLGIGTDVISLRVRTNTSPSDVWKDWISIDRNGQGWMASCDVNNLLLGGVYGLSSSATYQHLPTGVNSGVLEVIHPDTGNTYIMQRLLTGGSMYLRYRNVSSGTAWGSWYKFTGTLVT